MYDILCTVRYQDYKLNSFNFRQLSIGTYLLPNVIVAQKASNFTHCHSPDEVFKVITSYKANKQ